MDCGIVGWLVWYQTGRINQLVPYRLAIGDWKHVESDIDFVIFFLMFGIWALASSFVRGIHSERASIICWIPPLKKALIVSLMLGKQSL
jgi:hypothetical protein